MTRETQHPSLRIYKPQITRLSARLSLYQQNPKFAQTTLKRILTSFLVPSDPFHILYSSHLAYINSLRASPNIPQSSNFRALNAIRDLHELAIEKGHGNTVGVLALVLELLELVQNGFWNDVGILLQKVESSLALKFTSEPVESGTMVTSPRVMSNLEKVLVIHVLIIGTIFHTYVGTYANAQTRMKNLHDMLDGGALDAFGPSGIVEVSFFFSIHFQNIRLIQMSDTVRKSFITISAYPSNSPAHHIRTGVSSEQYCEKGPSGKEAKEKGICG